mgnify:CR=1 FL=1
MRKNPKSEIRNPKNALRKTAILIQSSGFGILDLGLSIVLCVLLILPSSAATLGSGTTSAEMLRLGFGARVPAMGGAMPAGARGLDAAWYNPAGLAWTGHREASASYQAMVEDINQGSLGYAQPFNRRTGIAASLPTPPR